jgi:DNA-binding NtrC family response regulator
LARSIIEDGPEKLFCGVGIFPDHAGSAQELIEVTRKAHAAANRSGPFRLARAASPIEEIVSNREESAGPVIASQAMKDVYSTAARLAPSVIPVLLLGETGTGKEVVASAIHRGGRRKKKPMICVNCGSIPEQLVESTLFGHEKGAYTGANQQQKGVFESAHGGTIFLDEIGELPLAAQAALLRVLEVSRFCRVGSPREIEVDVRVLAATHQDLESMCNKGSFREDLLYRLNAMTLKIPPLRERPDEIRPLAARFIKEANIANQCQVTHVDEDAMELLEQYSWPGNVRELKNAVTRAVVISENNRITIYDLPEAVRELHTQRREQKQEVPSGRISLPPNGDINLKAEISQYEADLILQALHRTNWDRNQAARSLGLPLRTLAYKMQTYGIRRTSYGPGKTNDHNK